MCLGFIYRSNVLYRIRGRRIVKLPIAVESEAKFSGNNDSSV